MAGAAPRVTFADLLRRARQAAGITQEGLAERAGLSRRGVSDLERGLKRRPHQDTIDRLADALGLTEGARAAFIAAARGAYPSSLRARARAAPDGNTGRAPAAPLPPLAGRAHEVGLLARQLAGDGPVLLLLAGEPGIGKSRLLAEAAARAHAAGWCVLAGGCSRRSGQEPYEPFVSTLARALAAASPARRRPDLHGCGWLVRLLPELLETALAPAPSWTLPPAQERRLMFAAVGRYLANVAGPAGTLLSLDDLQWAGEDALDLLLSLVQGAAEASEDAGRPLRVVGAYRSTEVDAAHPLAARLVDLARDGLLRQAPLGPLPAPEARTLLAGLLEADADAGRADGESDAAMGRILQRAGGVPYFLVSCAQGLRTGATSTAEVSATVPWDIGQSIRQRVIALGPVAREVLQAAAMVGRTTPYGLLVAMMRSLGRDGRVLVEALDAAAQARLLLAAEGAGPAHTAEYQFAHDLVREVILGDLAPARRVALHRAVAEAVEQLPEPERRRRVAELADHFAEAGEPARALPYALLAGEQAQAVYANAEAERHYRTAAQVAQAIGDQAREAEAFDKLGEFYWWRLGDGSRAQNALEVAVAAYRACGDRVGEVRAVAQLACAYVRQGNVPEGLARLTPLLEESRSLEGGGADPDARAQRAALLTALADLQFMGGRYREQLESAEQATQAARALDDRMGIARATNLKGIALGLLGRGEEALCALREAVALGEETGDLFTCAHALRHESDVHERAGAFDRAIAAIERGLELSQRQGHIHVAIMSYRRGLLAFYTGDWPAMRTWYKQAGVLFETIRDLWIYPYAPFMQGTLALIAGEREAGVGCLAEAIALSERLGHLHVLRKAHHELAEAELIEGHPEAARVRLDAVIPLAGAPEREDADVTQLLPLLAWACIAVGDDKQARTLLAEAEARAIAQQHHLALLEVLRVRALLDTHCQRWAEAMSALDQALASCRAMPYPYAEAKTRYEYGRLHALRGETSPASMQYAAALAVCDQLGEGLYRPHIERALGESR